MKTTKQPLRIHYIETARTASPAPVKIDIILAERIKAFRRAKELNQTEKVTK